MDEWKEYKELKNTILGVNEKDEKEMRRNIKK